MKTLQSVKLIMLSLLLALTAQAETEKFFPAEVGGVENQYIVILDEEFALKAEASEDVTTVETQAEELAVLYGGQVERVWESPVKGFLVHLEAWQAEQLARDPRTLSVSQDRLVASLEPIPAHCYSLQANAPASLISTKSPASPQAITCDDPDPRNPSRNCPDNWGLDRIDQTSSSRDGLYNFTTTTHLGVHVYVIDTGIDRYHNEFSVIGSPITRVIYGYNAIHNNTTDTSDCQGHGTHVAGIIGGLNTGVAKEVWLHPVKYYDPCGSGAAGGNASTVITALTWIYNYHDPATDGPAVVHWSGGNGSSFDHPDISMWVENLLDAGFSFVQSAGNQNGDYSCTNNLGGEPGLESVLVVGATDVNQSSSPVDGRWVCEVDDPQKPSSDCSSDTGSCIDIWAPGAHIVSAFSHDSSHNATQLDHCSLSGTSMAAPHVTGVVALYLAQNPTATPAQVHQAIVGGGTCGVLDDNPSSPYYIGDGSPNLLLNSLLAGGGCGISISDDFSGSGGLNGQSTDKGGVSWTARPATLLSGGVVKDQMAIGGVPFNPSMLPGSPVVELSADVSASVTKWVAVGFTNRPNVAFGSSGELWVRLMPDNTFAIHGDGRRLQLSSIPGTATGGYHQVDIRYDTATRNARVSINGTEVLNQILATVPNILYAGFHMHQAAEGGGKIDNFEVKQITTSPQVLIADTFAGSGSLNGRTAEVGNVTWKARGNGAVVTGGRVVDSSAIAGVPFNLGSMTGYPKATYVADVDPYFTQWVGVGFANQPTTAYWSSGQFWVLVRPNGQYAVHSRGVQLTWGKIPGTANNGFHHIELTYDTASQIGTVHINGVQVHSQVLSGALDIRYAGFHMYQAYEGGGKVDNFTVEAILP